MYIVEAKRIPDHQNDIRWGRRCLNRWKLFKLYRDQGDTREDDELMEHCKAVASAMNRYDSNMRYGNLQFALHEDPRGLRIRHVDAWAEGEGGLWQA